jgi:CubicO group peptidase (beta-lactamase class C family)
MISMRLFAGVLVFFVFAVAARADAVDDAVKAEMARTKAPGVIVGIVGADGKTSTRAYGLANVELNVPVSDKTIFQSGSVGKQFTSVAVMLLVEEGKIKLEAPITTYFKGAPAWWGKITVRHLLTHTSGLPDYGQELDLWKNHTEDDLEKYFHTLKPKFEPGADWFYSNPGYALLGILVRKVSGKFYGDVLKARVFAPLGMTTARVISEADIVMNRSDGYVTVDGALKNQEWVAPQMNTTADGSLYLTVLDLFAWDKGLRAKAILKPASWALVYTPVKLNSGKTHPYGFGWFLDTVAGESVYRHTGSWQGFKSAIARYQRRGLTVIVLANHAAFDGGAVAEKIGGKLP